MNRTNVPLSCSTSQQRSNARSRPASYSAGRSVLPKQEGSVDLLDVDPAVLHDLDAIGDLHELTSCLFGIGVRSVGGGFSYAILIPGSPRKRLSLLQRLLAGEYVRPQASCKDIIKVENLDSRPSAKRTS